MNRLIKCFLYLLNYHLSQQVIQVEFEGRNPMTSDFHGVRQLLQQLFLKSDINLSELADTVTGMFTKTFRANMN